MPVEAGLTSARERQPGDFAVAFLAKPKGGPVPKWTGGPKRGKKAPKKVKATQLELPIAASAGYDAARIASELASAVSSFVSSWPSLAGPLVNGIASDAAAVVTGGVGGLTSLAAGAGAVAAIGAALGKAMHGLSRRAARRAAAEVTELGVTALAGNADERAMQDQADVTAHLIGQTLTSAATRTALLHASRDADDVAAAVKADLAEIADLKSGGSILQNLASALASAQAAGRMATFAEVEDRVSLMASERNEGPNQCKPCDDVNGRVFRTFAAAAKAYPRGGYSGCAGKDRCRGHLQPVARLR